MQSMRGMLPIAVTRVIVLNACAPAPPASQGSGQQPQAAPPAAAAKKTIVFGVRGTINSFSLAEVGSGGPGRALTELWLQGLVTSGTQSQAPEARIASEVPSVDAGTMRVEADGTMTVTWKIRPDVK